MQTIIIYGFPTLLILAFVFLFASRYIYFLDPRDPSTKQKTKNLFTILLH